MFESIYIKSETIPAFDRAVSAAIDSYGIDGGGKEMQVAIENFDGSIYRVVTSIGMGAYIHATSSLLDLGLKDILANSIHGKDGYDSWFVTTPEMLNTLPVESVIADNPALEVLSDLEALSTLPETERQSLILSRVGQGEFRTQLVSYWKGCAVTGADCIPLLKASHIKPWRESSNNERLDVFNGFLLSPNIDAAFDAGYITFNSQGKIVLSNAFSGASAFQLHINAKLCIKQNLLCPEHQVYLEYHRKEVFRS